MVSLEIQFVKGKNLFKIPGIGKRWMIMFDKNHTREALKLQISGFLARENIARNVSKVCVERNVPSDLDYETMKESECDSINRGDLETANHFGFALPIMVMVADKVAKDCS